MHAPDYDSAWISHHSRISSISLLSARWAGSPFWPMYASACDLLSSPAIHGGFHALRHEMEYFCSLRHAPPSLPLHSFVVDETYLGLQSALFLPRCRSARMTPLLKVMHGPSTSVVLVSRQLHFTLSMEGFRVPFGHIANCVLSIRRDKAGARC